MVAAGDASAGFSEASTGSRGCFNVDVLYIGLRCVCPFRKHRALSVLSDHRRLDCGWPNHKSALRDYVREDVRCVSLSVVASVAAVFVLGSGDSHLKLMNARSWSLDRDHILIVIKMLVWGKSEYVYGLNLCLRVQRFSRIHENSINIVCESACFKLCYRWCGKKTGNMQITRIICT